MKNTDTDNYEKMKLWSMMLLMVMALPLVVACGDDDNKPDVNGGGDKSDDITGWYVQGGVDDIDNTLDNILNSYKENDPNHGYLWSHMEKEGGEIILYKLIPNNWGITSEEVYNVSTSALNWDVLHVVDKNTIVRYRANIYAIYADKASGKQCVYLFSYPRLGTILALYAYQSWYYTYWLEDGNKLYTTENKFYTVTSMGLIPDGSSTMYFKFDPDEVY